MIRTSLGFVALACLTLGTFAQAQSLKGSRAVMQRQYQEAVTSGYTFISTSREVGGLADAGVLVKVDSNRLFDLHQVSYPYALPEVKLFVERLSALYLNECGERMTVTSLLRPIDRQPRNAADDSVHPVGMAVDLRVPRGSSCRRWLESTLLSLEEAGVLDVTRERYPPHYHVAVFPNTYARYSGMQAPAILEYTVRRGDSLYLISRRTGASIEQLRAANGLRGDLIRPGQKLQVPTVATAGLAEAVVTQAAADAAEALVKEHKVKPGDTLWRIARLYGTTVNLLCAENGLSNDFLQVGKVLRVVLK